MISYIGIPGASSWIECKADLSTKTDRPTTTIRTLTGRRKAYQGKRGRREWDVEFSPLGSEEMHALIAISQHEGAAWWYPADATTGNMLSPRAAGFENAPYRSLSVGLVTLPDGSIARAVTRTAEGGLYIGAPENSTGIEVVPVPPDGGQVTFGVWGTGTVRMVALWRDAEGTNLTTTEGAQTTGTSEFTWRESTFTPPEGAVSVGMYLSASAIIARPVISWGPRALDRPARGCPAAVVHGLSESLDWILEDRDAYGSISVTIEEVG